VPATDENGSFFQNGKLTSIGLQVDNSEEEPTYSLMGMTGDQVRHVYFSIVEYRQVLIKQLGDDPGLETELFATEYLRVLTRIRHDMLSAFGEELGL